RPVVSNDMKHRFRKSVNIERAFQMWNVRVPQPRRRFSAMETVSAMAKAMLAESERKPAWSASTSSNQTLEHSASGEKAESVRDTTGTPRDARARAWVALSEA